MAVARKAIECKDCSLPKIALYVANNVILLLPSE
jgi:hypothetical protein